MTETPKAPARKPRAATTSTKAAATKAAAAKKSTSAKADKSGRSTLEIKIGVQNSPKEIVIDVDQNADEVEQSLAKAVADSTTLILNDVKGRRALIPSAQVSYIEIGEPSVRKVGFGKL
jgi:hypothetical protein